MREYPHVTRRVRNACAEALEGRRLLAAFTVRFDSFDDTTGLQLNGSASSHGVSGSKVLRLTNAVGGDGGSAFSDIRVNAARFSTFFSFRISNSGGAADSYNEVGADGLAFVIQPLASTIGGAGSGIGYGGIDRSVVVELDIFGNNGGDWEELNDPSSNHLGITTLGDPNHGTGAPYTADFRPDFDNGQLWYAWVDYNGTTLEARVNTNPNRPSSPTLSRTLNLTQIVEQTEAYIGFTAATGASWADHDIVRWEYRSDYDPITNTPEAEVRGNNVVITDNDTTPSLSDHTDFGSVLLNASPVYRTFTVRNLGQAALSTSSLTVPTGFTVTQGLLSSIAPGASDTFTVKLNTTAAGTFAGNISFANNDSNENPYNFAIKGVVNAPAKPEVEVRGNNVVIVDNDTTPSTSDHTDFGSTSVGASPIYRTFTVRNLGQAPLTTSGLVVPSGYTVTQGLLSSIAPGASDTFTVKLNTTAAGTFAGNISFANNDSNENPYNYAIKGVVSAPGAPEVEVRANNLVIVDNDTTPSLADRTDFGTVNVGTSLTQIFTVRNIGTAGLYTNTLTVPAGFTIVEGLAGYIAPGDSNTFSVRLNATAPGTFTGNVSFTNSDSNENPYNFAVKGVVNQPTFSLINGVLTVTGTSGPDYIRGSITSNVLTMKVNNLSQTFANASSISRIVVNALAGNDLIILASSVNRPTSLNGGDGNDTIAGGSGVDVINGGAGTDSAFRSGSDTVSLVEEVLS